MAEYFAKMITALLTLRTKMYQCCRMNINADDDIKFSRVTCVFRWVFLVEITRFRRV